VGAVDYIAVSIKMADIDKWIDVAKECKYLPENDLKVINSSYCIIMLL
jgi:serine/threonine-protein phosphatase 6 catalytic subunit